jgi:WD40 repeat protein
MRILQCSRTGPVTHVAIAADGRTLAAAYESGFDVFDLSTGKGVPVAAPGLRSLFAFVLDPLGRRLYLSAPGSRLWVYDLALVGRRRELIEHGDQHVISLAVSPDGGRLAMARGIAITRNHRLECWSVADDGSITQAWSVEPSAMWCLFHALAFNPAGDGLASIEDGLGEGMPHPTIHSVVLRDAADGSQRLALGTVPKARDVQSAFTPGGDEFALWDDRGLHLFATAEARPPRSRRHVGAAHFRGVAFHPSGRTFVTVANDGVARYWELSSLTQTQAFAWKAGKLSCVALSADGTLAAAGAERGKVVLWDVDC